MARIAQINLRNLRNWRLIIPKQIRSRVMSWKSAALVALVIGMAAMTTSIRATEGGNSGPVTYNKDVLPILQKNCQTCHRPGEIAPMSFMTYKDTRPWAKAMKAAVVNRQ